MYPVKREVFSGKLDRKNSRLKEAMDLLSVRSDSYTPPEIEIQSKFGVRSYYYPEFFQGSAMFPRRFWFVKIRKLSKLGLDPESPDVESDGGVEAKSPWDKVNLRGQIEADFLFATMLGKDLVPFGRLRIRPVVLPITLVEGRFHLLKDSKEPLQIGFRNIAEYLSKAETLWQKLATTKAKVFTISQWLNYRNKLTNQNPNATYKVLYVASATYLAACVINQVERFQLEIDSSIIRLQAFAAESKTYWYETQSLDEANYLAAILNSTVIDQLIKRLQTRGLFGPRDIHKRPLLLPIPKFRSTDPDANRLAELGRQAHGRVEKLVPQLTTYKSIGLVRSKLRSMLKDEMLEIDSLTMNIISRSSDTESLARYIHE